MPENPYEIGRWERDEVKVGCLIAINGATDLKSCRALAKKVNFPLDGAKWLIADIKEKHVRIVPAFGSDAGARLMGIDSAIYHASASVAPSAHPSSTPNIRPRSQARHRLRGATKCLTSRPPASA